MRGYPTKASNHSYVSSTAHISTVAQVKLEVTSYNNIEQRTSNAAKHGEEEPIGQPRNSERRSSNLKITNAIIEKAI